MTFPQKIGAVCVVVAVAACAAYMNGLSLPSLSWFYSFDKVEFWKISGNGGTLLDLSLSKAALGHVLCGILALAGLLMIVFGSGFTWNPVTLRRLSRFRSIGRGWLAFRVLILLLVLALLDQAVVGKRALAVKYDGHWYFPAFLQAQLQNNQFGGEGEQEADYRKLQTRFQREGQGNRVFMPLVPWDPNFDSQDVQNRELVIRDGKVYRPGAKEAYSGQAVQFHKNADSVVFKKATFRKGVQSGNAQLFDEKGDYAGKQFWKEGTLEKSEVDASLAEREGTFWVEQVFSPASPTFRQPGPPKEDSQYFGMNSDAAPSWSHPHYLGTDPKGWDVLATIYGGMQVLFKAGFVFVVVSYVMGIAIGATMGYFGGVFDLVAQRVQEVLSNMPFLLVIMVVVAQIGPADVTLSHVLLIYCAFSWISVAVYMRTASYREKARDYVAAARVQGAGTSRIIFKHILPNSLSSLVTLLPFSIAGVATSLTALDYLGFGLPESYPSWGRLMDAGTSNLQASWIVTSVVGVMVFLLLLFTFVGEALREAFDPKKFTTYK